MPDSIVQTPLSAANRMATLNDPLSGAEIKAILLKQIELKLNRDCTLADDITYAGFTASYNLRISFKRSAHTPETVAWGDAESGDMSEGTEEVVTENITDATYETDSPNAARVDHDLPIPVEISGPGGNVVRERRHIPQNRRGGR